MKNRNRAITLTCALLLFCSQGARADWWQFRGSDGSSVTTANLPTEFGGESKSNIAWETDLPGRAVSGPIVVGSQVITTASSGEGEKRLHVISLDTGSGKVQWQRRFWASGRTQCHPLSAVAAPTPASDGKRIYALFSSNDLVCFDLKGNLLWTRGLMVENSSAFDDRGLASSPWICSGTLVVQVACNGDSFAMGIDPVSGKNLWEIALAKDTNWATPCNIELKGTTYLVLQSAKKMMVADPKSGEIKYSYEADGNYIPSPTVVGSTILLPADGMTALTFGDEKEQPEIRWQENKLGAGSSSAVVSGNRVLVMRSPNILTAANMEDGKVAWKRRLKGNGFWATPILGPGHAFVPNTDGQVFVVQISNGEIVSENEMGKEILGSPAVSGDALYLRSTSSMIKVREG